MADCSVDVTVQAGQLVVCTIPADTGWWEQAWPVLLAAFAGGLFSAGVAWWTLTRSSRIAREQLLEQAEQATALARDDRLAGRKDAEAHAAKERELQRVDDRTRERSRAADDARARIYLDLLPLWVEKHPLGRGGDVLQEMRRLAWVAGDEDDREARALDLVSRQGYPGTATIEPLVRHTFWTNTGNRLRDDPRRVPLPPDVAEVVDDQSMVGQVVFASLGGGTLDPSDSRRSDS